MTAPATRLPSSCACPTRSTFALGDASILRAAQVAGCERLLSEDLHHGARYTDVVVENPFRKIVVT